MENILASLQIEEEEESGDKELWEIEIEENLTEQAINFCLIGCFFTTTTINFQSMRTVMANLWYTIRGVSITDIGEKSILFRFFCKVDRDRVVKGSPWTFNNHLFIIFMLKVGEDTLEVPLNNANFWVQIPDLPSGLYSENIARQFGDFIGSFIKYDTKAITASLRNIMRIRVQVDVRKPLKRRKRLLVAKSKEFCVSFKYEKLTTFYFLCGRLGHGESFCPIRMYHGSKDLPMEWDISLRALPR
ncbi:uncharacterized protein At4g02000-like [Gossypium arboreum]|uniref:DUF4283 domain-containing protein n=1 Tax=Gossypium arboreum TaxID=29729 RepID=A0ABR0QZV9_GOSAR|nr:uncharacterized protein At4g02000-like [Gossypium arboreum]KAK5844875.1 hypothetical protein PVK06_001018 [Gossypium arboreum]